MLGRRAVRHKFSLLCTEVSIGGRLLARILLSTYFCLFFILRYGFLDFTYYKNINLKILREKWFGAPNNSCCYEQKK